jgi:hypothetical protein
LVAADLADFSAATLAAVAVSQAFLEALSSASRDAMRAFAAGGTVMMMLESLIAFVDEVK